MSEPKVLTVAQVAKIKKVAAKKATSKKATGKTLAASKKAVSV